MRQVLNQIIVSLPEAHPVQENGRPVLRDTLGHTPAQVGPPATRARTHTSLGLRSTTGSASHARVRYAGGLPRAAVSANPESCRNAGHGYTLSLTLSLLTTITQVCAGAMMGLFVAIVGHDSGTWRTVYD
jgi:hypothetical protein